MAFKQLCKDLKAWYKYRCNTDPKCVEKPPNYYKMLCSDFGPCKGICKPFLRAGRKPKRDCRNCCAYCIKPSSCTKMEIEFLKSKRYDSIYHLRPGDACVINIEQKYLLDQFNKDVARKKACKELEGEKESTKIKIQKQLRAMKVKIRVIKVKTYMKLMKLKLEIKIRIKEIKNKIKEKRKGRSKRKGKSKIKGKAKSRIGKSKAKNSVTIEAPVAELSAITPDETSANPSSATFPEMSSSETTPTTSTDSSSTNSPKTITKKEQKSK